MDNLFFNTVKNVICHVRAKTMLPGDGKETIRQALSGISEELRENWHDGMPAKYFQKRAEVISIVRASTPDFIYAFDEFSDIFPLYKIGFKFKHKLNILRFCVCAGFVLLTGVLFFTLVGYFQNTVPYNLCYSTIVFMLLTCTIFWGYEKTKKIVENKIKKKEEAEIKKMATELDKMLAELATSKYVPSIDDGGSLSST